MKQTVCDICGNVIIKNNDTGLFISMEPGIEPGIEYKDICRHCAGKIRKCIRDIVEAPRAIYPQCGQ